MSNVKLIPSSATEGFFQALPVLPPQFASHASGISGQSALSGDDRVLASILAVYLPNPLPSQISEHLHLLAQKCVSSAVLKWTVDAELNLPTLHSLTTFGEPNEVDALHTSEGWRRLKDMGIQDGTVALGYTTLDSQPAQWNRRMHQMSMNHLWSGSAALVTCPAAMSDGAAILLGNHINDPDGDQPGRSQVLREARERLISLNPAYAWTSGQWMTERTGGSDVRKTQSTARRLDMVLLDEDSRRFGSDQDCVGMPLGPWRIDGFKWFSSATDADMVVMLAQTSKGLSAFYAPMRRKKGTTLVMNGVRITRLKQKLGTKALPTSELEIKGMRAWLIGEEGRGVKEIAAILNATRIWTACGATGGLGRGLAVARAYSRVRMVQDKLLQDNLQHVAWMAEESVKYRASLHLAFLGVGLLGVVEQGAVAVKDTIAVEFLPHEKEEAETLLRFLVPVMKAQCSLAAVSGLRACMESLGGVGYCENNEDAGIMNVARIFRDTNVNPIWEGTTSVMAEDVVRVLKGSGGRQALDAFERLLSRLAKISRSKFEHECSVILAAWSNLKRDIETSQAPKLHYTGRMLLGGLESIICSLLLMLEALVDHNPISAAVVSRWMYLKFSHEYRGRQSHWQVEAALDKIIFLGNQNTTQNLRASL